MPGVARVLADPERARRRSKRQAVSGVVYIERVTVHQVVGVLLREPFDERLEAQISFILVLSAIWFGCLKAGIDALGFGAWLAALVSAALAALWAGVGYWLGRSHDAKQQGCCTPVESKNPVF